MRPLLVGQAPSRTSDPRRPLEGKGAPARLAGLLGMRAEDLNRSFRRMNVLDEWPGRCGKGDAFPAGLAREAAKKVRLRGRVVFLGKGAARAFGFRGEFLGWSDFGGSRAAIFPHPSGVNRWFNDAGNRRRAREFMEEILSRKLLK